MESHKQEMQPYSPEWFKNRALSGLRHLQDGSWNYSDSLLLYVPGSDDEYEAVQETDTSYNKLVTVPERKYLENIASDVVTELPEKFEYIDLGPGTEHKEQFIFDAAKDEGKNLVYRPIDISDKYLSLSTDYALAQGLSAKPLKSSFEELPEKLGLETDPRFVSIGLTYGNYSPAEILDLLKRVAGEQGTAFINAQIRERTEMEAVRSIYADVAPAMVAAKIRLLGLDPEKDISDIEVTDEVKVWYTLKNPSAVLESKGIRAGDRLLVFQSLRPTIEKLEEDVSATFADYKVLDTGDAFVGILASKI